MKKKDQDILNVRNSVGWVYDDLNWVNEAEAAKASKERAELLDFLHDNVNHSYSGTKIHTGPLSPGCRICGDGFWSCMFINQLCTANCFFCPQDRTVAKEDLPCTGQGMVFRDLGDYADFLVYAGYKGVGFSGGEPFLAFDRLLSYIKKIRDRCGDTIYLWVYTNGDLAEKENLSRLRDHGLNEIRFNISARDYALGGVMKALTIIDTVTVEIPAIPEDFETVKRSLALMQEAGVSHVNLHQLLVTKYNYKEYAARKYTFLHQDSISVLESEMTALRLMKYAVENHLTLPINYCNSYYKSEFQVKGNRERIAILARADGEELTETGHIRKLAIMKNDGMDAELVISGRALQDLNASGLTLAINYYEPRLKSIPVASPENSREAPQFKNKIIVEKNLLHRLELEGSTGIEAFRQMILEKKNAAEVKRRLLENCRVGTREELSRVMEMIERVISLKIYEHGGSGFPEIY